MSQAVQEASVDEAVRAAAYDVAVVGGGAAGFSAAVALLRFGRSVVVIDDGAPRNAAAGHVHNLFTRDGTPPAELYRLGHDEVERYGGRFVTGTVRSINGSKGAFAVRLDGTAPADSVAGDLDGTASSDVVSGDGGQAIAAHRIIVATGGRDELPDVPGLAARWGKDVVHCPFCHGYEVRGQRIGVLATGPMAVHQAMMFRLLSPHVTVLAHTAPPTPDQTSDLAQRGISVVPGVVAEVVSCDDHLTGVRLADGSRVEFDALVVATVVHARAGFLAPLGLLPTDFTINGHVVATRIETGPNGATDVPGVWIAGNASEPMAQVVTAAAGGLAAASAIISEIVAAKQMSKKIVSPLPRHSRPQTGEWIYD